MNTLELSARDELNIVSMDGGNGIITAQMLHLLDAATPGFLTKTGVFAGTSAGGINALFFAREEDPSRALPGLLDFWNKVNLSILQGIAGESAPPQARGGRLPAAADGPGATLEAMLGLTGAALGFRSMFLNRVYKQYLIRHFGADTTLGDLKQKVVIVSFQLDNQDEDEAERCWQPRVYTNMTDMPAGDDGEVRPEGSSDDKLEKVVDVALRTSAAPVQLPIYQSMNGTPGAPGFVDGALAANNPCMVALAAITGTLSQATADREHTLAPTQSLPKIHMLSVGTGRNLLSNAQFLAPEFSGGSAAWGYRNWLLDPANPLLLVDAFLEGGNLAAAWQCEMLLTKKRFHRLNVPLTGMAIRQPEGATLVERAARWIHESGWFHAEMVAL